MVLGAVGMLVGSRATSMGMVIGGQTLSGIGLTCGYLAVPLVSEIVPKYHRPAIGALTGVVAGGATSTGSIISGAFIKYNVGGVGQGWRGGFYIGAGFYVVAFALLAIFYHPAARSNPENLSVWQRLRKVDWPGVFGLLGGLTMFLVGLQAGGNPYPWKSAKVLAPLIIGFVMLAIFVVWEWKGVNNGILHHSFFQHSNFSLVLVLAFVGGMILFGGQAFIPQEIVYLFTSDAILTGVYSLPFNLMSVGGSIVGGVWMGITKEAKSAVIFSYVVMIVGNCLMIIMHPHINFAAWFFPNVLLALAVGIQTALLVIVVSVCTPNHLIAGAMAVIASIRALGGSIGITIFSQIFASKVKTFVPTQIAERAIQAGLPAKSAADLVEALLAHSTAALEKVPGITPSIIAAASDGMANGYADAFRYVWYSLVPFPAISLILSFFLKSTKAQMTAQIAAGVEHRH
ncbi:hypothetical protein KCU91_g11293, partial [Aureobasidium melanogenum]